MGGKALGCLGAIKQSTVSSSSAASGSPGHVAIVVKLQWHPSWNRRCFRTGKWWRKQETGVCEKRRSERADGPWHFCEICCEQPSSHISQKLQVPYKQEPSFAEMTVRWAFSDYGQSPFMAGIFNVSDGSHLSSLDLSPQPWKEPM